MNPVDLPFERAPHRSSPLKGSLNMILNNDLAGFKGIRFFYFSNFCVFQNIDSHCLCLTPGILAPDRCRKLPEVQGNNFYYLSSNSDRGVSSDDVLSFERAITTIPVYTPPIIALNNVITDKCWVHGVLPSGRTPPVPLGQNTVYTKLE